jgi:hypothetical protein
MSGPTGFVGGPTMMWVEKPPKRSTGSTGSLVAGAAKYGLFLFLFFGIGLTGFLASYSP